MWNEWRHKLHTKQKWVLQSSVTVKFVCFMKNE